VFAVSSWSLTGARNYMEDTNNAHVRSLIRPIACLLLAWLMVFISLWANIEFGGNWLARSGSLMVLFSVMANYVLLKDRDDHHSDQLKQHGTGDLDVDFSKVHPTRAHQQVELTSQISIVIGTVIWGYGDLILMP